MSYRDIPNLISMLRILLTIPVVWALSAQRFDIALLLFAIAAVSDGLDGFLAKRFAWNSQLGGLLDPLADKVLLISSVLVLGWLGLLPLWLVFLIVIRDLIIITGAAIYHYRVSALTASPSWISKVNTVMQLVLVLSVILSAAGVIVFPVWLVETFIWLTLCTTVLSGADYILVWSRKAVEYSSADI